MWNDNLSHDYTTIENGWIVGSIKYWEPVGFVRWENITNKISLLSMDKWCQSQINLCFIYCQTFFIRYTCIIRTNMMTRRSLNTPSILYFYIIISNSIFMTMKHELYISIFFITQSTRRYNIMCKWITDMRTKQARQILRAVVNITTVLNIKC